MMTASAPPDPLEPKDEAPHSPWRSPAECAGINVVVVDRQTVLTLPVDRLVHLAQITLQSQAVPHALVTIYLVDDRQSQALNRRLLQHDWPTDVITSVIAQAEPDAPRSQPIEAELFISTETAARQAAEQHATAWDEVGRYLVHGLLHLLGHNDANEFDAQRMRQEETRMLRAAGWLTTQPATDPSCTSRTP
jgi:probable rRNA maturation factor